MLPISVVENPAWIEYMRVLDPSFSVPTRETVKLSGINNIKTKVFSKLRAVLNDIQYVNVSVDGWSDKTIRCFNGYIAQGIDNEWVMQTLPIAFQHLTGKHTGEAIKKQFEAVSQSFNLKTKTFKLVADQAANVKKAFVDLKEADDVININIESS